MTVRRAARRGASTALPVAAALALLAIAGCADEADDPPAGSTGSSAPAVGDDHWHSAVGVYVCDGFLPDIEEFESPEGIHTHGDGVIHIHPFSESGAGDNARLGVFLDGAGIALADGELRVDGETYADGDDCGGEPGRVVVARWSDVRSGDDPQIVNQDAADLRFDASGEGYTIAFVPEGTDPPMPESAPDLDALGSVDSPSAPTDPTDPTAGEMDDAEVEVPASGEGAVDDPGFRVVIASVPMTEPGATCPPGMVGGLDGSCYELDSESAVDFDAVASAEVETAHGQPTVALVLTGNGIDSFNALAEACVDLVDPCATGRIAIVADGVVVSAPSILEPEFEADAISISGDFDRDEAQAIADALAG